MSRMRCLALVLPLLLACGRPASDLLRQRPAPPLALELSLPDGPDQADVRRAYLAAFHEQFGKGLAADPASGHLQLLVMIGDRAPRPAAEAKRNRALDEASAVASGSPVRVLLSATEPKSDYEAAVDHLGYRPAWVTGKVVVLNSGKNGFQKELSLDPWPILYRMHPLGKTARTTGGPTTEEARAVAEQTLELLKTKLGWTPPAP